MLNTSNTHSCKYPFDHWPLLPGILPNWSVSVKEGYFGTFPNWPRPIFCFFASMTAVKFECSPWPQKWRYWDENSCVTCCWAINNFNASFVCLFIEQSFKFFSKKFPTRGFLTKMTEVKFEGSPWRQKWRYWADS